MTVAQLIADLQKMPQDYDVQMAFYWTSGTERHPVENVENCEPTAALDHRVELSWTCSSKDEAK